MEPVRFEGMNSTFVKEGCGDLPARIEQEDGHMSVISCWKPSEADLKILNAGGCICLNVIGGQPPVALWAQEVNIIEIID